MSSSSLSKISPTKFASLNTRSSNANDEEKNKFRAARRRVFSLRVQKRTDHQGPFRLRTRSHMAVGSRLSQLPLTFRGMRFVETVSNLPSPCPLFPWTNVLRLLLCGTKQDVTSIAHLNSPLSLLRGHESTILRIIYSYLVLAWKSSVQNTLPAHTVGRFRDPSNPGVSEPSEVQPGDEYVVSNGFAIPLVNVYVGITERRTLGSRVDDRSPIAQVPCGHVQFPDPTGRKVNMMPFVIGDRSSLPKDLEPYYDAIILKCPLAEREFGTIGYLTVDEGEVAVGKTQRRGGIHTEAPGAFRSGSTSFVPAWEHHWGRGMCYSPDEIFGGFFIASTIERSCKVWDALIDVREAGVDGYGGCEHLRPFLGEGTNLKANEIVWLTDRTPHEALPQECTGYRQFFRLVTSEISVWFADHSTPNPKVPLPKHIKLIYGNKFERKS